MQDIIFFSSIVLLAAISPGPDYLLVFKNALRSREWWIASALWIGVWVMFHITYCLLWLWYIISQSIYLFNVIKFGWALYLWYLGIMLLLSKSSKEDTASTQTIGSWWSRSLWSYFKEWLLTNLLNPKATIFFVWLFSQIITPYTSYTLKWLYILDGFLIVTIRFVCLTLAINIPIVRQLIYKIQSPLEKVMGVLLCALWMKIATE